MRYAKSKMKEIVKSTGLSIATVSRALNEETASLVKPGTREKVLQAAEKLNYTPDRAARCLRLRRNNTLGFLMNFNTDRLNGYVQEILDGVMAGLAMTKYDLKIVSAARFGSLESVMKTHGLDGLILSHAYKQAFPDLSQEADKYSNKGWPVVIINDYRPGCHVNQFYSDNALAASTLTDYVIKKKHRKIYFIGSEDGSPDAMARKKAFVETLKKHGIRFNEEEDSANGHFQERGGYESTLALFSDRPEFRGAIFCANDAMALGAIRALGELALKCPQDVAVVGFDGIASGEFSNPPLTTIKFELAEMGRAAVIMLDNIIRGRQKVSTKQKFPFRLIERGSC